MVSKKEFEDFIWSEISRMTGDYIELTSGDVHRTLGGYPNNGHHNMPTCCDAMYEAMKGDDKVLYAPNNEKGRGATLKIRYYKRNHHQEGEITMSELKQEKFNEVALIDNFTMPNEPHLACVLLLDTSGSMSGKPIESLNKAINKFKELVCKDKLARQRVDVAIIEFNSDARVVQEFAPIFMMEPVTLSAGGATGMGTAINMAIDRVKKMNQFYASLGTPCFKPWIFMITDGEPTDDISSAIARIKEEERKNKLKFWAIGAPGYNKKTLQSLTKRCISIDEASFEGIFHWLSESMVAISVSRIEENPQLSNLPADAHVIPSDW